MNFTMSPAETMWRERFRNFMNDVVRPHDETYAAQQASGERWKTLPIIEELKARAKADGICNLFMPPLAGPNPVDRSFEFVAPGLTTLDSASCAEEMGRIKWASEVFNCSAPDTGNMALPHRYGTREPKACWPPPPLAGRMRPDI